MNQCQIPDRCSLKALKYLLGLQVSLGADDEDDKNKIKTKSKTKNRCTWKLKDLVLMYCTLFAFLPKTENR